MFDNLTQDKKGDAFYVSSLGQTLKYEVVDIAVVKPEETDSLRKVPGRDLVTLITCTPYGVNSHRLLVTGERVPMDPTAAAAEEAKALPAPMQTWMKAIIVAVVLLATLAVVYIEQAQRRIPVQYAKRMIGRRQYGGSTTYIPVKINTAGVIPVIFASSILAMPQLIAGFGNQTSKWVQWILTNLQQTSPIYLTAYGVLILFFAFFYTAITFDAEEIADNMKRYGGFIPGIRAGEPTARYLRYVINRVTVAGSVYLVVLALLPTLAVSRWLGLSSSLPFGGTTILIMVGVGLQTVKEINSQLQQRHYEGFLS